MKKALNWIVISAFLIFLVDWAIIGLKLLDNNDEFYVEAWLALFCLLVIVICALLKCMFFQKCPHCGKTLWSKGAYCPHCGKKL